MQWGHIDIFIPSPALNPTLSRTKNNGCFPCPHWTILTVTELRAPGRAALWIFQHKTEHQQYLWVMSRVPDPELGTETIHSPTQWLIICEQSTAHSITQKTFLQGSFTFSPWSLNIRVDMVQGGVGWVSWPVLVSAASINLQDNAGKLKLSTRPSYLNIYQAVTGHWRSICD